MIGMRRAFLIALAAVWTVSYAADNASSRFGEQLTEQERIYRGEDKTIAEGYTVDRSLDHYTGALAAGFAEELAKLGPTQRWLDIGAGQARAILDYYAPASEEAAGSPKAGVVAISIEDRRTPVWQRTAAVVGANRMQYLFGKRLREYSPAELGRFQLITDVVGGFSYTEDLSLFMERVLGMLEVNGNFFTILQDVQGESGTSRPHYQGSPFLTEIVNADGSQETVCAWLKRIGCVQVTCESREGWVPPLETFRVTKICENVSVPALTPIHYQAGTPPERRFQLKH